MFSITHFLEQHHIEYVDSGPNISRGNIGIACPFCGDDPSHHLGINPETLEWNCWRDSSHRGRKLQRLIMKLIGCSYEQASEILGVRYDVSDFDKAIASLIPTNDRIVMDKPMQRVLDFPRTFRAITRTEFPAAFAYLCSRGYDPDEVDELVELYDLKSSKIGGFASRVIIPCYDDDGNLVNWTGRAITDSVLRYKTLSRDPERSAMDGCSPAIRAITDGVYLPRYPYSGTKGLIIAEGPMDAIRLDFYGRRFGVRGTCTFTVSFTTRQVEHIHELAVQFDHIGIMYDDGALDSALRLQQALSGLNAVVIPLPSNVKDPALLNKDQVRYLIKKELFRMNT